MFKTRFLLGLIMLAVIVGLGVLWNTDLELINKGFISIPELLLFAASGIMLGITFFTLDERGRIPRESMAYRYFARFYDSAHRNEEGQKVEIKGAPDSIRLCVAFWMVVLGLFLTSGLLATIGMISGIITIELVHVAQGNTDVSPWAGIWLGVGIGALVVIFGIIYGLKSLYKRLKTDRAKNIFGWTLAFSLVMLPVSGIVLGTYFGTPLASPDVPAGEARLEGFKNAGIVIGTVLGTLIGVILFVIALVYTPKTSSWFKNTLVGKLVGGAYHHFCPVIEVEPAAPTQEEAQVSAT